ncbi:MAG TPA: hypothetical protein V6D47_02115 [Oscillatoriaceae cyanobacterium]
MDEPTSISPAVEARFRALAGCVGDEDWSKLITAVSDRLLKRLSLLGLIQDASAEQLVAARNEIGNQLVEFTNVALTCVAQGEIERGQA